MKTGKLTVIYGPMCSGKTTVAEGLSFSLLYREDIVSEFMDISSGQDEAELKQRLDSGLNIIAVFQSKPGPAILERAGYVVKTVIDGSESSGKSMGIQTRRPWPEYDDSVDYCGPDGCRISKLISRYILGCDVNRACWAHDQRYADIEFGPTDVCSRLHADRLFLLNMQNAIRQHFAWWDPRRPLALLIARRRYQAVRVFGAKHAGGES